MTHNLYLDIDKHILADSGISGEVTKNLLTLCDQIGPRFAGTDGHRRAAEFMLGRFRAYALENAELEPFDFTAWRRGDPARFTMQEPFERVFDCYALPYGASTGPEGVRALLLDIGGGAAGDIEAHRDRIKGRLVLTNGAGAHRKETYAQCVDLGATGVVFSNPMPGMLLHTGSVCDGCAGPIPAISIACETALQLKRFLQKGEPHFTLTTCDTCEPATTWNVVGELRGSEYPDEMVLIGGHLDSHDIGPGAYDNGAGAVMVMEVARLLAKQSRHLKRTIRFIGFAAEEIGLLGSHYHARTHAESLRKARFMLNCDMPGLGRPRGLAFHQCPQGAAYLSKLSEQMGTEIVCQNRSHPHSDHYPFILQGLPTAGVGGGRFAPAVQHFVHMAADTPDKVSLTDLQETAAFAARFLLRAANDEQWPDMRRSDEEIASWR